jgi:menaquinone-dependent protoporphyrinogen oxidase
MAGAILVAYGSRYGSTQEVAESSAAQHRSDGLRGAPRAAADGDDHGEYGGVVLGGGIYIGRWHRDARGFVKRFAEELAELPVAVFALGPVDDVREHVESAQKQFDSALAKLPVDPFSTQLFGGAVDPLKLNFPFNRMPAADVRDWDAVREWANELGERFKPAAVLV